MNRTVWEISHLINSAFVMLTSASSSMTMFDDAVSWNRWIPWKNAITELNSFHADGGRAMVDFRSANVVLKRRNCGRFPRDEVQIPRPWSRSGKYYYDGDWSDSLQVDQMAGTSS